MIIQNLLGQNHKFYLIGGFLFCLLDVAYARDLFLPFEKNRTEWALTELNPIPLRIQYHGKVKFKEGDKYIFLVNGRCVYAGLNETMPDQFVLKQIIAQGESVIVQDNGDGCTYTLKLGGIAYRPMCFCGKIMNKNTKTYYTFSHVNNRIKLNQQEILLSMRQNDFNSIEISIFTGNKVPFSCILHKN